MEKPITGAELGAKLRARRLEKRLTQQDLGKKIAGFLRRAEPITKATVSKWEGGALPSIEMVNGLALASILDLDPFELMGYQPPARSSGRQQYHRQSISEAAALVGLEWDKLGELDAPYAAMFREALELLVAKRKRDVAERGKGKRPRDDSRPGAET